MLVNVKGIRRCDLPASTHFLLQRQAPEKLSKKKQKINNNNKERDKGPNKLRAFPQRCHHV